MPFTRLDNADPYRLEELMLAVERVAHKAAFTLGEEVELFEQEFAAYCETSHAVGVSSGTAAIELALRALGIGRGHEVIVPANTFIATAEAVSALGAHPRLVDVDPDTGLLTAAAVEEAIGPHTRAVVPVHLYGRTVDMDPILEVARRHVLFVIEDACQAHGARYKGSRVGSLGHAGCFSFYPTKNLGAWGDGGAVTTADPKLAERIKLLRSHGESVRHEHRVCAGTERLDGLQAAILRTKLTWLDEQNTARRAAAAGLSRGLAGTAVATPAPVAADGDHVFHLYVVTTEDRDGLRDALAAEEVATAIHYPTPVHLQPCYEEAGPGPASLPVAERLAGQICSLPLFPAMSDIELERVVRAVRGWSDSLESPLRATG